MDTNNHLEEILQKFEPHHQLFRLPLTLSYEHDDVTVKYLLSSLRIASEETQTQMVSSFCERFGADKVEMNELLGNPHNWADYQLYTAFSIHCQQQLGLDDKTYFQEVARKTFLDYQDGQIMVARAFPLSAILMGMPKQFKNWTKVTEVQVDKIKASLNLSLTGFDQVILRRRTLPEYRARLGETLGFKLTQEVLRRDCDLTLHAFTITFQELFGQKDLKVERTHSEADGNEWSKYVVCPSSPYQSLLKKGFSATGKVLLRVFVPWAYYSRIQTDVNSLRGESFEREHTIRSMTEQLEKKTVALQYQRESTVDLLKKFSKSRIHGGWHSINNRLKTFREGIQQQLYEHMANQLHSLYLLSAHDELKRNYLLELCAPFEIEQDTFKSIASLHEKIKNVEIIITSEQKTVADTGNLEDLFSTFTAEEIYLHKIMPRLQEVQEKYALMFTEISPAELDPFALFKSMVIILETAAGITRTLESLGNVELLDKVKLSDAVDNGIKYAQEDKKSALTMIKQIDYNPYFNTNKNEFITTFRDLFYNVIDAGATEIIIKSINPNQDTVLPYITSLKFANYPAIYVMIKDNGDGIQPAKAEQLNAYLEGKLEDNAGLSTKGKDQGGLGTKNLRNFLSLHQGHCYYEPDELKGTRVHLYFERLEI